MLGSVFIRRPLDCLSTSSKSTTADELAIELEHCLPPVMAAIAADVGRRVPIQNDSATDGQRYPHISIIFIRVFLLAVWTMNRAASLDSPAFRVTSCFVAAIPTLWLII